MSDPTAAPPPTPSIDRSAKPHLPRGVRLKHDDIRGEWVLLAPERMLKLNAVSVEILQRCTGEATIDAIIADLAQTFAAPPEQIGRDIEAMLLELTRKRLVDL